MRKILIILSVFASVVAAGAQTVQKGRVMLQNSGGKALDGVQVTVYGALPTDTDNEGRFSLSFPQAAPGDLAPLKEVYKKGYELVNRREAERWIISGTDDMVVVMCEAGKLRDARQKYYNIGNSQYLKRYESTLAEIEKQKGAGSLNEKAYNEKLEAAYDMLQESQKRLDEYADLFARVNRDDLSRLDARAFELVERGDLDGAIALYESERLVEQILKQGTTLEELREEISDRMVSLKHNADIYIFAGGRENLAKAGGIYKAIVMADQSDFDNLVIYGRFLRETLDYHGANEWLAKALDAAGTPAQVAEALYELGFTFTLQHEYTPAENVLKRSIGIYESMSDGEAGQFYRMKNALTHSVLASTYWYAGRSAETLETVSAGLEINHSYPVTDSLMFYRIEAQLLGVQAITIFSHSMYNSIEAETLERDKNLVPDITLRAIGITRQLLRLEDNLENGALLTSLLANLAAYYMFGDELGKAEEYYKQALARELEMSKRNPLVMQSEIAILYNSMGQLYMMMGREDEGLEYTMKAYELRRELMDINPNSFRGAMMTSLVNIGEYYRDKRDYDKALEYYEEVSAMLSSIPEEYMSAYMETALNVDYLRGAVYKERGEMDRAAGYWLHAYETMKRYPHVKMTNYKNVLLCELIEYYSDSEDNEWVNYTYDYIMVWNEEAGFHPVAAAGAVGGIHVEEGRKALGECCYMMTLFMADDYLDENPDLRITMSAPAEHVSVWNTVRNAAEYFFDNEEYVWSEMAESLFDRMLPSIKLTKSNAPLVDAKSESLFRHGISLSMMDKPAQAVAALRDSARYMKYLDGLGHDMSEAIEFIEDYAREEEKKLK